MNFYQIFLPVATLFYLLIVFVLRSFWLWRQTGTNAFVFGHSDKAHDYIGLVYKVLVVGTWFSIACFSFIPKWYEYLLPIWYMENDHYKLVGAALLVFSFVFTSIAQYQMSGSWRIGIDYTEKTKLIDHGLFRYSRNPVFLGVLVSYLGTFLIIPNILSFSMLLVTFVTIQIQVRLEEEYLQSIHGSEYHQYRLQVRRWF